MKTGSFTLKKSFCLLAVTVIFSLLTFFVDRQAIGWEGTSVGFASLNGLVQRTFGYNAAMDKISDIVMVLAFAVVAAFAVYGAILLIKKKSLGAVGKTVIGLGILYVIVVIIYVAFKKIPVNFRPIIPPGETELETSYPSTHTLIIGSVFGSAIIAVKRLVSNESFVKIATIASIALMVIGICARFLAGVHWATDIAAGILFSLTLVSFYAACSKD